MIYFTLIIVFVYSIVLLFLFFRLIESRKPLEEIYNKELVTVLIAVRNEQDNVPRLIENLKKINYCCFEVVIVDDHSEDDTVKLLCDANLSFIRVVRLPDNLHGKKNAIKYGLSFSTGNWILFTDADVIFSGNWINALSFYFNQADFILAPVLIKQSTNTSFLFFFETIDVLAMQAFSYAVTKAKYPFLASAANMAVKKDIAMNLYNKINTNIPSGDDVFLLHEYLKDFDRVLFTRDADATVFVDASKSWSAFLHQRLRWASKAKYYRNSNALFFSWLIFLSHALPLVCFIEVIFNNNNLITCIILLGIKFLVDVIFMIRSLRIFNQPLKYMLIFPLVWFFYFFYISFVPLISMFYKVEWKNRSFK